MKPQNIYLKIDRFFERMVQLEVIADIPPRAEILDSWLIIEETAGKAGFIQAEAKQIINPILFIDWLVKEGKMIT